MGQVLALPIKLESVDCGRCGGSYALNERFIDTKREEGGSWHCPYCQSGWGYGGGELAKAKAALESERTRHAQTLARANEASAERDKAERKLKRVAKGICPECKRTFANLAQHMACKHKAKK